MVPTTNATLAEDGIVFVSVAALRNLFIRGTDVLPHNAENDGLLWSGAERN